MALAKQIIRVHDTYANLVLGAGASELQLYMIGIASDTDEFIFRSDDGYHRCLDSGTAVLSEHTIPFINASGKVTQDNTNLQFNDGTNTLTAANILIANSGYIGSISDADAIQIEADGDVVLSQDLAVTGTLDVTGATTLGTLGCGEITVADGSGINLQEDITFTGATTENKVLFPDDLAVALSFGEGANIYQSFDSTDGSEAIRFSVKVGIGAIAPAPLYLLHVLAADGVADNTYVAYFSNAETTVNRNNGVWINAGSSASDYNIRCASLAGAALWSVTGAGLFTIDNTLNVGAIGVGIAPDATTIGKFYRNDASTDAMVQIEQDSTGDAAMKILLTSGQAYMFGIDNSIAGDLLKISPTVFSTITHWGMDSVGRIGMGIVPSSAYQVRMFRQPINTGAQHTLWVEMQQYTLTNPGTFNNDALVLRSQAFGNANNAGTVTALRFQAFSQNTATLSFLDAMNFEYGQATAGITTFTAGLRIKLRYATGTIGTAYDIKFDAPTIATGTADTQWVLYSDHDAPSRLINALQIASDTNGLVLGGAQDSTLIFNGTDTVLDYDVLNAGTTDFRIQEDGVNRLTVLSGAGEVLIDASGYLRTDTARYRRYYHLAINSFDPGASGAAWGDASATQLCGWNLNADTDTLEFGTDTHNDWDAASDLEIDLKFSINLAGGAPADTVDWQLLVYIKGVGDVVTKTQTLTESTTIDADAQFTKYTQVFTIDYDAGGGNQVDILDDMCFVLTCEATGDVTDVRVTGASYNYHTTHTGIESGDT